MKQIKYLVLVFILSLLTTNSFSAGFGLYEFSARGNAMGGAVLAGEAEPASIALNPALITQLSGSQIQLGGTLVTAAGDIEYDNIKGSAVRKWWVIPNIYYTQQIANRWFVGLGAFSRFGLSNDYPDRSWAISERNNASLFHAGVTTYSIQPTLAFQATDRLSVSAGLEIQYLNFTEGIRFGQMANNNKMTLADLDLDGDSTTTSGIFAFFYKANEEVNFGGSFRMRTKHHVKGNVDYNYINNNNMVNGMFIDNGDFWGDIVFPAQLALGASWKPTDRLLFEFNWTNVFWSSFNSVDIYFDNVPGKGGQKGLLGTKEGNMKQYKDSYRIGLGAEYKLSDVIKLRGSFIFDKSPLNDEFMDVMLPVHDRYLIGTGVGINLSEDIILDVSYTYLIANSLSGYSASEQDKERVDVKYENASSHLAGLSIRYKF